MLIASAAMLPFGAAGSGQAAHLPPPPLGIMQDGDGAGNSAPMAVAATSGNQSQRLDNFYIRSVLYNGSRFPLPNGETQRPGFKKYAAWGTVTLDNGDHQLAFTTSDDGQVWTRPSLATIQDPATGEDIPFVIGTIDNMRQFAVGFSTLASDFQFSIYYMRHDPSDPDDVYDIANFRRALSQDGVTWIDNPCSPLACNLSQGTGGAEFITGLGSGTFKEGTYGPTDVKFQPAGSTDTACGTVNPWNCRWVMTYATVGVGGEQTGIAWSGNGTTWNGRATPLIPTGGAGTWDELYATMAHVQRLSAHDYVAYYSGGNGPANACYDGFAPCLSLGTAYSTDGLNFTKTAANPVTPSTLTSGFLPDAPHSLMHAQAIGDGKIHYAVLDDTVSESAMLARPHALPAAPGINIRIDNPINGTTPVTASTLVAYVTDDLGAPAGINAGSISAEFENLDTLVVTPVTGMQRFNSLVGSLRRPAIKVTRGDIWSMLTDGPYELRVTAADLESNTATATVQFTIDRVAPDTIVTSDPATPVVVIPGAPIAVVEGETTDATSPILGLRAVVRNPLGVEKAFEVNYFTGQSSNPPQGFSNLTRSADGRLLTWRWVAPGADPHLLLPGSYTISFIAFDSNFNIERRDVVNTVDVFVI